MRIRKNTKLSSVLLATAGYAGQKLDTYVCHLNQSPWDVIPLSSSVEYDGAAELTNLIDSSWFLPSPSSSSPSIIHQFDGEDSFTGNVSLGHSSGAAGRLNTSVENNRSLVSVQSLNLIAAEDYERSPHVDDPMDRSGDSDKKSNFLKPNSPVITSGDDDQAAFSMPAPPKRGRPRGTGKKASASSTAASNNPYEFYYYSGFGPRWGRKRGGSGDENIVISDNRKNCEDNLSKKSSSSDEVCGKTAPFADGSSSFDGFEYMEEDYDVVDQASEYGKNKMKKMVMMKKMKRGRKPVKERFFPPWAAREIIQGNVDAVVDSRLNGEYNNEEATRMATVAIWCIQDNEEIRPALGTVVKMLEGVVEVTVPPPPKLIQPLVSGDSYHGVERHKL